MAALMRPSTKPYHEAGSGQIILATLLSLRRKLTIATGHYFMYEVAIIS